MIIGASGTGKSEYLYRKITEEAESNRGKRYFVIVPDQFTMQTQMDMVLNSTGKGIMNIDVLSFSRLAHRIFEKTNAEGRMVLDDTGKSLILRRLVTDIAPSVPYLSGNLKRIGFIHEVKSSISEFMQYGIGLEELDELIRSSDGKGALHAKLKDLSVLYGRFLQYIGDSYITTEESMDLLARELYKSEIIKDSVVVFDGFTGFTPVQLNVIDVLSKLCDCVYITLTLDVDDYEKGDIEEQDLFSFTNKSIQAIRNRVGENNFEIERRCKDNFRYKEKEDLLYLERNVFRNVSDKEKYGEEPERIHLYEGKDIKDEAAETARQIRELIRGGAMYREIAVITGSIGDYENHIIREFSKYDIPVYIDKTRAIVLNPFVEYTKSILQVIKKNFDMDSVCRLLRTGMGHFETESVDIFENYCLRTGLKGKKKYLSFEEDRKLRIADKTRPLTKQQIDELEVVSQVITELLAVMEPLLKAGVKPNGINKASGYVEGLYDCFLKINAFETLKSYEERFQKECDYTREKEYGQIYRLTLELLEQIHDLIGDESISLEEFIDILEAGFEEISVGTIPQSVDKVIVGDIERSRLKPVKYLFFMGLNDNNIPKRGGKASIISDMEREFLAANNEHELAPTPHQKMFIQRFYLYSNLVKPSEKLYLSYSNMGNDGKSLRPAYLVAMIARLFPKLSVNRGSKDSGLLDVHNVEMLKEYICDLIRKAGENMAGLDQSEKEELFKAISVLIKLDDGYRTLLQMFIDNSFFKYEDKKLDGVIAGILYGETLLASVSRMEKYAECAYSYFLQYGLSLKERNTYEIDNRDLGTIFHETLKNYGDRLTRQGISWMDVEEATAREILDEELAKACEYKIPADSKVNQYILRKMSKVLYKAVDTMSYQLRLGKYTVSELEVPFSRHQVLDEINVALSVQEKMQLNGRIDRIDTMDTGDQIYVKVIDYKTGKKDFSLLNFYHGLQLQLVVYMSEGIKTIEHKYKGREVLPGALLYYRLADDVVDADYSDDEEAINAKIRESLKTKGLINDDDASIEGIAGITSGKSDVVPVAFNKDGSFSANSAVMSRDNLNLLRDYAAYKLRNIGDDIIAGKITMNPVKEKDDKTSCTYCAYKGVCGFEERLDGYSMSSIKKEGEEELLEKMKNDMETE